MKKIPVAGPSITELEVEYVTKAVADGWYDNAFGCITEFEERFRQYVGRNYAIAMPSCTSSIHTSLLALGIGAGDEVVVPDITWIATSSPVSYVGATPVFADIDKTSWCISLDSIKSLVTEQTKAIIAVDLYGNMPEMDDILAYAEASGIYVIEDAAQALGSEYKGRKAGSFGDFSVFSFHGTKILTTGEGGMILTDDDGLYRRCLKIRDLGRSDCGKMFFNDEVAHKYKMSNIQAALGLAQLERFDEILEHKRQSHSWYLGAVEGVSGVFINSVPEYSRSNYWMNTAIWDLSIYPVEKEQVMRIMKEQWNIDTRPFFYPLTSLPAYAQYQNCDYKSKNPVAYEISPYGINLPSSMKLDETTVDFIAHKFVSTLKSSAK